MITSKDMLRLDRPAGGLTALPLEAEDEETKMGTEALAEDEEPEGSG